MADKTKKDLAMEKVLARVATALVFSMAFLSIYIVVGA